MCDRIFRNYATMMTLLVVSGSLFSCITCVPLNNVNDVGNTMDPSSIYISIKEHFNLKDLLINSFILSKYIEEYLAHSLVAIQRVDKAKLKLLTTLFENMTNSSAAPPDLDFSKNNNGPSMTVESFKNEYIKDGLLKKVETAIPTAEEKISAYKSPVRNTVEKAFESFRNDESFKDSCLEFEKKAKNTTHSHLSLVSRDIVLSFNTIKGGIHSLLRSKEASVFSRKSIGLLASRILSKINGVLLKINTFASPKQDDPEDPKLVSFSKFLTEAGPLIIYTIALSSYWITDNVFVHIPLVLSSLNALLLTPVNLPHLSNMIIQESYGYFKETLNEADAEFLICSGRKGDIVSAGGTSLLDWLSILSVAGITYLSLIATQGPDANRGVTTLFNIYDSRSQQSLTQEEKNIKDRYSNMWLEDSEIREIVASLKYHSQWVRTADDSEKKDDINIDNLDIFDKISPEARRKVSYLLGSSFVAVETILGHLFAAGNASKLSTGIESAIGTDYNDLSLSAVTLKTIRASLSYPATTLPSIFDSSEAQKTMDEKTKAVLKEMRSEVHHLKVISWMYGILEAILPVINFIGISSVIDIPPVSIGKFVALTLGTLPRIFFEMWTSIQIFLLEQYEDMIYRIEIYYKNHPLPDKFAKKEAEIENLTITTRYGIVETKSIRSLLFTLSPTYREARANSVSPTSTENEIPDNVLSILNELTNGDSFVPTTRGSMMMALCSAICIQNDSVDNASLQNPVLSIDRPGIDGSRIEKSIDEFLPTAFKQQLHKKALKIITEIFKELELSSIDLSKFALKDEWTWILDSIYSGSTFDVYEPVSSYIFSYKEKLENSKRMGGKEQASHDDNTWNKKLRASESKPQDYFEYVASPLLPVSSDITSPNVEEAPELSYASDSDSADEKAPKNAAASSSTSSEESEQQEKKDSDNLVIDTDKPLNVDDLIEPLPHQ